MCADRRHYGGHGSINTPQNKSCYMFWSSYFVSITCIASCQHMLKLFNSFSVIKHQIFLCTISFRRIPISLKHEDIF